VGGGANFNYRTRSAEQAEEEAGCGAWGQEQLTLRFHACTLLLSEAARRTLRSVLPEACVAFANPRALSRPTATADLLTRYSPPFRATRMTADVSTERSSGSQSR
jgi:hypothetical protein